MSTDCTVPTIGSLFAGIGGFDLGFERAGFQTLWQVEIDPWARRVLEKNFPHAERFSDIRDCGRHNLQPVDVLCGGFPCQDISNAGLRAGIEGERSGLWGEFARIIGELRPKFVLIENVAALLGRGMVRVLCDLAALGYDAEWEVVSAADVGAPHLRERVWILAYPCGTGRRQDAGSAYAHEGQHAGRTALQMHQPAGDGEGHSAGDIPDPDFFEYEGCASADEWPAAAQLSADANFLDGGQGWTGRPAGDGADGQGEWAQALAYRDSHDAQGQLAGGADPEGWPQPGERSPGPRAAGGGGQWAVEPDVGRVAHGVPRRVDRLRGLGNAVVPQIPELYARRIRPHLLQPVGVHHVR